ncbi:MAG: precorrin-8X methylmutase, partial [Methanosarcinales archaeon]|nr:precorrin-8X methylmutase [Methanosarcinales archaeon]
CRLVEQGIHPALIVATPVGFVNAAESKELVRTVEIANITCMGTRGGTPIAVSVVNELVAMAQESS